MSSLSGDGDRPPRPRAPIPRCPFFAGPPRLGPTTELRSTIMLGSRPLMVNDDVVIGGRRDGQSPTKCLELAQ